MRISDWSSDVCSSDLSISQEVGREIPGDARLCLPVQSAADGAALPRPGACLGGRPADRSRISLPAFRSEEHTSELQSLMRISYAVFCLKKKNHKKKIHHPRLPNHPTIQYY